jgi:hypothetical protein
MTKKVGPNEPCPCGSGRKFKKCCRAPGAMGPEGGPPHTTLDRASAFRKLDSFVDKLWEEEEDDAFEEFWGRFLEREDELPPGFLAMSRDVQETWFEFDYRLENGSRIIDEFLRQAALSPGERAFLTAMQTSSMRFYEVTEIKPGSSMTLRDLIEGTVVTVSERSASRTVSRHDCLAARVIPRGCSGRPEMEVGMLGLPSLYRDQILDSLRQQRSQFVREHPGESVDEFYRLLPPIFHEAWLASIFEPAVPQLANTDGEAVVITRVSFHVKDEPALRHALDEAESDGLTRVGDHAWRWSGASASGGLVLLASFELGSAVLTLEANSVERGARARELVERLAGAAIGHRGTTHEDLRRQVVESVRARALRQDDEAESPAPAALDPDLQEALVLQHQATHYRAWVDEPVPALDGQTPRAAARLRPLRPRVEDLIHGLEGMYERALKDGGPAYDPSWMWAELGLETAVDALRPPPLAHERVAERVPGSAEASRTAAERFRSRPSFSDTSTTLTEAELSLDLALQRFLRREATSAGEAGPEAALAAPYLPLMVNLDLHRRKLFSVDAALSYMLENTEVDVAGRELRTPFPSFAIVFADRHTLSLGERLLARRSDDPLRGQILRVVTVYVTERHGGEERILSIAFAFDALGADLPSLVHYEVPAGDAQSLRAFLDSVAPRAVAEPEVRDSSPARGLLRLVLNTVLYATSAGVTPEARSLTRRARPAGSSTFRPLESDSVFFLPGTIDIRRVRQLEELSRAPGGRALFARFMVRGHWRRPAKNWMDQRLRWIEPYWKGPDLAAVIEKAYRLRDS